MLIALLLFMIIRLFFLGSTFGGLVLDAFMVLVFLSCVNAISEKRGIIYIVLTLFVIAITSMLYISASST